MRPSRGTDIFVRIEGPRNCGKSTFARFLQRTIGPWYDLEVVEVDHVGPMPRRVQEQTSIMADALIDGVDSTIMKPLLVRIDVVNDFESGWHEIDLDRPEERSPPRQHEDVLLLMSDQRVCVGEYHISRPDGLALWVVDGETIFDRDEWPVFWARIPPLPR